MSALGEELCFQLLSHAPIWRVLASDLSLATGWRPGEVVLLVGLAVLLVALARMRCEQSQPRSRGALVAEKA